jgi:hypothetical protein
MEVLIGNMIVLGQESGERAIVAAEGVLPQSNAQSTFCHLFRPTWSLDDTWAFLRNTLLDNAPSDCYG